MEEWKQKSEEIEASLNGLAESMASGAITEASALLAIETLAGEQCEGGNSKCLDRWIQSLKRSFQSKLKVVKSSCKHERVRNCGESDSDVSQYELTEEDMQLALEVSNTDPYGWFEGALRKFGLIATNIDCHSCLHMMGAPFLDKGTAHLFIWSHWYG